MLRYRNAYFKNYIFYTCCFSWNHRKVSSWDHNFYDRFWTIENICRRLSCRYPHQMLFFIFFYADPGYISSKICAVVICALYTAYKHRIRNDSMFDRPCRNKEKSFGYFGKSGIRKACQNNFGCGIYLIGNLFYIRIEPFISYNFYKYIALCSAERIRLYCWQKKSLILFFNSWIKWFGSFILFLSNIKGIFFPLLYNLYKRWYNTSNEYYVKFNQILCI